MLFRWYFAGIYSQLGFIQLLLSSPGSQPGHFSCIVPRMKRKPNPEHEPLKEAVESERGNCLQCGRPLRAVRRYMFFCSKDCAANWGDDEVLMQSLKLRQH
jgi:hypothetical protein